MVTIIVLARRLCQGRYLPPEGKGRQGVYPGFLDNREYFSAQFLKLSIALSNFPFPGILIYFWIFFPFIGTISLKTCVGPTLFCFPLDRNALKLNQLT